MKTTLLGLAFLVGSRGQLQQQGLDSADCEASYMWDAITCQSAQGPKVLKLYVCKHVGSITILMWTLRTFEHWQHVLA